MARFYDVFPNPPPQSFGHYKQKPREYKSYKMCAWVAVNEVHFNFTVFLRFKELIAGSTLSTLGKHTGLTLARSTLGQHTAIWIPHSAMPMPMHAKFGVGVTALINLSSQPPSQTSDCNLWGLLFIFRCTVETPLCVVLRFMLNRPLGMLPWST